MNAIVVRNLDGSIRHMGPADGNYDPSVPAGCTKAVESGYETLIQQHLAELRAAQGPSWATRVNAATNIADLKALLKEMRT